MAHREEISIEWICTLAGIEALEPQWRELEGSVLDRTVHSRFDWVYPWYRSFATGPQPRYGEPLLGVATIEDRIVGLAPFVSRRARQSGLRLRCADLVGFNAQTGEILVQDDKPWLVGRFVESLLERRDVDVIRMNGFAEGTKRLDSVREAADETRMELLDYYYPVVDLEHGYEHYLASRSTRYRRSLRRQANTADKEFGGWELERHRSPPDDESLTQTMDRTTSIYNSSWKTAANTELLPDDFVRFYRDIAQRFAITGDLDLSILRLGDGDAAFFLALKDRDVVYDVFVSYDQRFKAVRPGEFLVKQLLPEIARDNCRLLVSHGDHEYKKVWLTDRVRQLRVLVYARTARAFISHLLGFKLMPLIRRLRRFDKRLSLPSIKPARRAALRVLASSNSTLRKVRFPLDES